MFFDSWKCFGFLKVLWVFLMLVGFSGTVLGFLEVFGVFLKCHFAFWNRYGFSLSVFVATTRAQVATMLSF